MAINPETQIQRKIMLCLSEAGCTVWRNETKRAWVGKVIHQSGNQVTIAMAQMILFGIAIGSSDIVGISPNGKFLAVEVKTATGRATKEQLAFIEAVRAAGGIAGIARTPEEAINLIKGDMI